MKLDVTITSVDGSSKTRDLYADEIAGLMGLIMNMASARPTAPVCLTITRKDVLRKFSKHLEEKANAQISEEGQVED